MKAEQLAEALKLCQNRRKRLLNKSKSICVACYKQRAKSVPKEERMTHKFFEVCASCETDQKYFEVINHYDQMISSLIDYKYFGEQEDLEQFFQLEKDLPLLDEEKTKMKLERVCVV